PVLHLDALLCRLAPAPRISRTAQAAVAFRPPHPRDRLSADEAVEGLPTKPQAVLGIRRAEQPQPRAPQEEILRAHGHFRPALGVTPGGGAPLPPPRGGGRSGVSRGGGGPRLGALAVAPDQVPGGAGVQAVIAPQARGFPRGVLVPRLGGGAVQAEGARAA